MEEEKELIKAMGQDSFIFYVDDQKYEVGRLTINDRIELARHRIETKIDLQRSFGKKYRDSIGADFEPTVEGADILVWEHIKYCIWLGMKKYHDVSLEEVGELLNDLGRIRKLRDFVHELEEEESLVERLEEILSAEDTKSALKEYIVELKKEEEENENFFQKR